MPDVAYTVSTRQAPAGNGRFPHARGLASNIIVILRANDHRTEVGFLLSRLRDGSRQAQAARWCRTLLRKLTCSGTTRVDGWRGSTTARCPTLPTNGNSPNARLLETFKFPNPSSDDPVFCPVNFPRSRCFSVLFGLLAFLSGPPFRRLAGAWKASIRLAGLTHPASPQGLRTGRSSCSRSRLILFEIDT